MISTLASTLLQPASKRTPGYPAAVPSSKPWINCQKHSVCRIEDHTANVGILHRLCIAAGPCAPHSCDLVYHSAAAAARCRWSLREPMHRISVRWIADDNSVIFHCMQIDHSLLAVSEGEVTLPPSETVCIEQPKVLSGCRCRRHGRCQRRVGADEQAVERALGRQVCMAACMHRAAWDATFAVMLPHASQPRELVYIRLLIPLRTLCSAKQRRRHRPATTGGGTRRCQ